MLLGIRSNLCAICIGVLSLFFSFLQADEELITKGAFTYGDPAVYSWGEGAKLSIGKYCSIASHTSVFLGGNHRPDWVTTYPFNMLWPEVAGHITGHPATKGDVIIGNDVWLGMHSSILSGVKIGDGAVVGAHAVVTKDVPPYAIVAGNPARVVKMRFDAETIQKLLQISWWDWPEQEVAIAVSFMLSTNVDEFIQYCESNGKIRD